jgi:hypothetical protein
MVSYIERGLRKILFILIQFYNNYYGENKWGNHHRNISYLFSDIIYYSRISKSCLGAAFLGRCSYISDRHRICNPRTLEPKKTSGSYSFRAQEYSVALLMGYFILLNKDPSIDHEQDNRQNLVSRKYYMLNYTTNYSFEPDVLL